MSIFAAGKGGFRYSFNRVTSVNGEKRRFRFTKLLPRGWPRSKAEAWGYKKDGELFAQISGIERQEPLIAEAVKLYLEKVVPHQKHSARAIECLSLLQPYYAGKTLSALPAIAEEFIEDHAEHSIATNYHRLAFLKAAAHFGFTKGIGQTDYSKQMDMPKGRAERQTYIKVSQLTKLLGCIDEEEAAALVKMAFFTGLRWRSELLPLQPENVIRNGKDIWLSVGMTKNGSPRMVPVHPSIKHCLRWLPFTGSWYWYWCRFDVARKKAGFPTVRMHDLRHSLASAIVSAGGTLVDVAGALHHESLSSSRRYSHLYPERVRAVILKVK